MTLSEFFRKNGSTRHERHEVILRPDEYISNILYLDKGYVRMFTNTPDGKELTLNIFKPKAYFPISCVLNNTKNMYYYQSLTTSVLYSIPNEKFLQYLHTHPEELFALSKRITSGLDGYLIHTQHLLFGNARRRIASTMILCALRFGEKRNCTEYKLSLQLTHQDIGSLTSLTRETVSIEIEKLKKENILFYEGRTIIIKNIDHLYAAIGEDTIHYAEPNIN